MPFITGPGGDVYYRRWAAERPLASVLFLHGFGEHSGHYHRFAHALNHAGIDVWSPDHVGHGLTHGENGSFESVEQLAKNAERCLQHVARHSPGLPIVLAGHSLGGVSAAYLATRAPMRLAGLVLTGTPFEGLPAAATTIDNPIMSTDEAYLDALATDPLRFETGPAEANLWASIQGVSANLLDSLPGLSLPTLLINGELDIFAPPYIARKWAGMIPNAHVEIVPNGYHDIPNDASHRRVAEMVIDAVKRWTD